MMTKEEAKVVQREVGDAITAVYARHGLVVKSASVRYGEGIFNLQVKAVSSDPAQSPYAADWRRYARGYTLPEEALGKTYRFSGKLITFEGLDLGRRKYPVRAQIDGVVKLLTVDYAKAVIAMNQEVAS